jgi:hypothetical protein
MPRFAAASAVICRSISCEFVEARRISQVLDGAHVGYGATQPVRRCAATRVVSAAICRSAYYWGYATCVKYGRQQCIEERKGMTLKRMDNVLIVVDDLEAAKLAYIRGPEGLMVALSQQIG